MLFEKDLSGGCWEGDKSGSSETRWEIISVVQEVVVICNALRAAETNRSEQIWGVLELVLPDWLWEQNMREELTMTSWFWI